MKIRLGMVGTGRIIARVMTDMANAKDIELTAIASRDQARADEAAARYGIPHAFGSYEALAESDCVDLVYIATPHPFHLDPAMLMMRHGKHVLCEKPITADAASTRAMIQCARENGVFLMEAMWTRFMPAMQALMAQLNAGVIGEVRHIDNCFSGKWGYDPADRAFAPELAGGALLDLGIYNLMAITSIYGWEPAEVRSLCCKAPTGVDMRMSAQLLYPDGRTAHAMCGMDAQTDDMMRIYGTKGFIEMPGFWHPNRFTVHADGRAPQPFVFPEEHEGHHYQFDHAAACIREGRTESPVVTLAETMALSELCTAIRRQCGIRYPFEAE